MMQVFTKWPPRPARRVVPSFRVLVAVTVAAIAAVAIGGQDRGEHAEAPHAATARGAEAAAHAHDSGAHEGHADEVRLTPEAIRKHGIRVEPTRRKQLGRTFAVPARVSFNGDAMAHVGSAVKGRIAELKVRVGDRVKKDDVLLVVESPELGEAQLDLIQKRAAVAAGGPLVESAKAAHERAGKLYGQQGISLAEVQKRESEFRTTEANLRTSRTAAAAAEARLLLLGMDKTGVDELARTEQIKPQFVIRSPIPGDVIEREVTLGELVGPDRDHFLVVADMTKLWVLADVPEARLKGLNGRAQARVTLAAMPGEAVTGTVSFVSHVVDPATRTAKVRIEVDNKDGDLRPGMFGSIEIVGGGGETGEALLAVPDDAVQTVEGGPAVFVPVEGEENTFAKRAVTVGKPVGGWVPVLSGLKEGEPVVVAGTFLLKADLGKSGAAHEH